MADKDIKRIGTNSFTYRKNGRSKTSNYRITPNHEAIKSRDCFRIGFKAGSEHLITEVKRIVNALWNKRYYLLAYTILTGSISLEKVHELIKSHPPFGRVELATVL